MNTPILLLNSIPPVDFPGREHIEFQDDNQYGYRWNTAGKHYEKWFAKHYPVSQDLELEQVYSQLEIIADSFGVKESKVQLVNRWLNNVPVLCALLTGWVYTDKVFVDAVNNAADVLKVKPHTGGIRLPFL